jgi:hypothetical protein
MPEMNDDMVVIRQFGDTYNVVVQSPDGSDFATVMQRGTANDARQIKLILTRIFARWQRAASDGQKIVRLRYEAQDNDHGDIFLAALAEEGIIPADDYRNGQYDYRNGTLEVTESNAERILTPFAFGSKVAIWRDEPVDDTPEPRTWANYTKVSEESLDSLERRPHGYYLEHYDGGTWTGPFPDVPALARHFGLTDYPDFGSIYTWDGETVGGVPSLNPDDLLPNDDTVARQTEK